MLLRPRYLPVHMLRAHISVIYKIALLYFVVTAHELLAPGMLMDFSGFCNCLEIHFCPQACPLPGSATPHHHHHPPPPPRLGKDLSARPLLLPADPWAAFSILVN